jgi:hypothetical protein
MPDLNEFSLEERVTLRRSAEILRREFEGVFGVETIERFLQSSYTEFAGRAGPGTSWVCWPSVSPANG